MINTELSERELEYLRCETPLLRGGSAAMRLIGGVFASFAQAVFSPSSSYGKADRGLMQTVRLMRYTRYKKAVLRKQSGTLTKKDEKILSKVNKTDFILAPDTYDPDAFTQKVYEEYMQKHDHSK